MTMRVLHVIPSLSPAQGGPTEAVIQMVRAMIAEGVEAEIACTDDGVTPSAHRLLIDHRGVPVRFFPRAFSWLPVLRTYSWSPSFTAWLDANVENYDLLHIHGLFSHLPSDAMHIAGRAGVPYLLRPLGTLGHWPLRQSAWRKQAYLRLIERALLCRAAALHFVSEFERDDAACLKLDPPGVVIPHGVHVEPKLPEASRLLRERAGLAPDRAVVLFLGRLHGKKGVDLLLRSLTLKPQPRPCLIIAGDGPERAHLERLAHELNVTADVRWLGFVEGEARQICLQGADLFALPSHHENLGLAVLEALAAGTPVLVSVEVALAQAVQRHRLGVVVPLSAEAIAVGLEQGLGELKTGPECARRQAFVAAKHSWPSCARALSELYATLVERGGHDARSHWRKRTGMPKTPVPMKAITTYAPGRAELLGNHTDYNEGYVLAIAVDRGTTLTGHTRADRLIELNSRDLKSRVEIELDQLAAEKVEEWSRYTLGVVDVFRRQGLPLGGFSAEITSTLPMGAGLSSSASLENAAVLFLLKAFGGSLPPIQMAQFSQMAEHDFVGVRCGLLDQIASLMSHAHHATFIDCRTFAVRHLPLSDHVSFVLAQSGVKHSLVAGEYNERRSDCEAAARALGVKALRDTTTAQLLERRCEMPDRIYKRARHITGENERVLAGSAALEAGDLGRFGDLMYESHESSRLFFENSCPELDALVEAAREIPGVYGARLSGGGFGGATINLVERGREEEAVQALCTAAPGVKCLITSAAPGALDLVGDSL